MKIYSKQGPFGKTLDDLKARGLWIFGIPWKWLECGAGTDRLAWAHEAQERQEEAVEFQRGMPLDDGDVFIVEGHNWVYCVAPSPN